MSLVTTYEAKIKEIVHSQIGEEKILEIHWEPDSGRAVFAYRGTHISKSGRKSKKWHCFSIMVVDDDMADALKERGISRDMWEKYLGTMIDNLGLDFDDLMSPALLGEFGIIDDRYVDETISLVPNEDYMNAEYFMWWDEMTTNTEFLDELAEAIKALH